MGIPFTIVFLCESVQLALVVSPRIAIGPEKWLSSAIAGGTFEMVGHRRGALSAIVDCCTGLTFFRLFPKID